MHGSPRSMEVGGPAGNNAVLDSSGEGHHCFRGFAGGPCGIGDRVGCRYPKMMRLLHVARKAGDVSTDRCPTVTEAGVEQMRARWAVCTTGAEKEGQWRRRCSSDSFGGAENKRVGFLVGPRAIMPSSPAVLPPKMRSAPRLQGVDSSPPRSSRRTSLPNSPRSRSRRRVPVVSVEWGQPDYGHCVVLATLLLLLGLIVMLPIPFAGNARFPGAGALRHRSAARPTRHLLVKAARAQGKPARRSRKRDRFQAWWSSTAAPLVQTPPPASRPWSPAFQYLHQRWRTLRARVSTPPSPPPPSSHWVIEHRGALAEVCRAVAAVLLIRRCMELGPAALRSVRRWQPAAMGGAVSLSFAPDGAIQLSWLQIGDGPEDRWRKLALLLQQRKAATPQAALPPSQAAPRRPASLLHAVPPQLDERSSPSARQGCSHDGGRGDQPPTCLSAHPLRAVGAAAPPQGWAGPGAVTPGALPPAVLATASAPPHSALATAPPSTPPPAPISPGMCQSIPSADVPSGPHVCRLPPAHLVRCHLRLARVSAQAVACDAASAASATGDPPCLNVMLEAIEPPSGCSPQIAAELLAVSSLAVGAGVLSLGIPYEAFSAVAARLRLADGASLGDAARPPLERWMTFIPRRLYSSRRREALAFLLSVVLPTASLAWAAWALYANVGVIDRAVAWVGDAAVAAATAFVGERLVPLIRLTRSVLAHVDAALRAATVEFYARLRPALVVAMPLLRQLGGIARMLAPAGQAAAEAALQAVAALRCAAPPLYAAWAACSSSVSALLSAGRAVTQGIATAISAVARASVGVSLDMPRRWVTWLRQVARFKETPAAAQARNVLKTAALQAHKLTSPNARQAMKERLHTFTPTAVVRRPPLNGHGPSRADRVAHHDRSISTPLARNPVAAPEAKAALLSPPVGDRAHGGSCSTPAPRTK